MNVLKFLLMAVLLQGAAAPNDSTAKNGSIEGIVVGAAGEPLAKVEVSLTTGLSSFQIQPGSRINTFSFDSSIAEVFLFKNSVTTGSDGRFVFEGLSAGKYHITAERPGYIRTEFGQKGPDSRGQPINLKEGENRRDVRLSMLFTGTITGHIVDSNGEPVIGARIQALKHTYTPQGKSLAPVATVITDDSGAYRLFWLPPGSYIVSANLSSSSTDPFADGTLSQMVLDKRNTIVSRTLTDGTNAEETTVPVYYPSVSSPDNATAITVRGGSTTSGTDMTIAPVRVFKIRGKTINSDSGQIDYASILLSPKSVMNGVFPERRIQVESNGYFEIPGVVPGSYLLIPDPPFEGAPLAVEVANSDVNNANLSFSLPTLNNKSEVRGRILIEGMTQSLTNSKEARRLNLSPMVGPRELSFISVAVDGTFSTKGILPGDYRISLQGEPSYFIKSIRLGNREAVGNIVNLSNAEGSSLEVVLTSARGKVEGRILNERREAVTNGTVVLVPEPPLRDRTDLDFVLNLDESGIFSAEAMPGHYVIYAWEDIEPYAWLDAEYMKNFENRGRPVNIVDGGNESVDVSIIPYVP